MSRQPLSVGETLKLHGSFFQQGLSDSMKWNNVLETLTSNQKLQGSVMKAALLQVIILVSALAIEPLLDQVNSRGETTTSGIIPILFHVLWLYPLSIGAIYYAGLLRSTDNDGERRAGSVSNSLKGGDYRGLTSTITSESYRVLLLLNYFGVVYVFNFIPYLGPILSFIYASIVDSYYCYESIWLKQSWSFEERVSFLSSRWSYFVGFGIPITAFSSWLSSDPVVNLAIFSLLYPLFNIMANTAIALPLDPDLPTSSRSLSFLPQGAVEGGDDARGRRGNPMIPQSLPVLIGADKLYALVAKQSSMGIKKKDASGGAAARHNAYSGYSDYRNGGRNQTPPASSPYQFHAPPPQQQYPSSESGAQRRGPPQASGFADRSMDSLISNAVRRSKRD